MADDGLEKQHQASSKRIADLRKKGQTLRSRDLAGGLIFVVTVITLLVMSGHFQAQFKLNFVGSFNQIKTVMQDDNFPGGFVHQLIMDNFTMMIPVFLMCLLAAIASPFIFGGWNFSLEALGFKFEKLNPIGNLKNMFSKRIFVEIGRSLFKVSIITAVLFYFAYTRKNDMFHLLDQPLHAAMTNCTYLIEEFIVIISVALIAIVLFDVIYNYYDYQNKIKMTSQELKDEYKEAEGSVEVKRKLRSKQLALFKQRLTIVVPKATVIITNPTHYAIALRYDENKDHAPKVVAKGKGFIAQQIRTIAISNGVPIYQAPELARAIYHTSNINSDIQPGLYMSVAIVLSYIHQLRNYQQGVGQQPKIATELNIPKEFIYND